MTSHLLTHKGGYAGEVEYQRWRMNVMQIHNHPLFRKNAVKHYMQSREKDTLPRFIPLPITLLLWSLCGFLLVVGGLAWYQQIPIYVIGQGIVLNSKVTLNAKAAPGDERHMEQRHNDAIAVVFLAPSQASHLRVGQPVVVHVGSSGLQLNTSVAAIEPSVISPYAAYQRYKLTGSGLPLPPFSSLITQPSIVVLVNLGSLPAATYAGSMITVEVEVGSRRIISLLPGLGNLFRK